MENPNDEQSARSWTMPVIAATPPPTPPATSRPILRLSASLSPTPIRQRQVGWWQASVVRRSSSAVDDAVEELTEKSRFLLRSRSSMTTPRGSTEESTGTAGSRLDSTEEEEVEEEELAVFHREEILAGQLLGEGAFSCVYEVVGFALHDDHDTGISATHSSTRRTVATASPTRFALKHLKNSLLTNTLEFEHAATDLVMEAKYLGALKHTNILKLHGHPLNGTAAINGGVDGYFLLCDRLSETMEGRMERWRNGQAAETNNVTCKLSYALQIAQALAYLHEQRIIFRDLKPSNIGFHQEDTERVQLFDFGLCRELPPPNRALPYVHGEAPTDDMDVSEYSMDMDESYDDNGEEKVFFMSGAGTQIYMAPEALVHNRYNLKADVYSWAMTVTELLLLEKPLPRYDLEDHIQYVCVEADRPALEGHPEIPISLRDLLAWAWEADVANRCNMAQICEELPEIIAEMEEEKCMQSSWATRLRQTANCFHRFLHSMMRRAMERVSSFFFQRTGNAIHRDVTFDLPDEDKKSQSAAADTPQEGHRQKPLLHEDKKDSTPGTTGRSSESALYKRKPSSASTTAMTDDEFEDDYCDPLSPLAPLHPSNPPLEPLVERLDSNASQVTIT